MEIVLLIAFGYLVGNIDEKRVNFETKVEKSISKTYEYTAPRKIPIVSDGCSTEITKIYYSKASGEITTCEGRLLNDGEQTRIVRVSE